MPQHKCKSKHVTGKWGKGVYVYVRVCVYEQKSLEKKERHPTDRLKARSLIVQAIKQEIWPNCKICQR